MATDPKFKGRDHSPMLGLQPCSLLGRRQDLSDPTEAVSQALIKYINLRLEGDTILQTVDHVAGFPQPTEATQEFG